MNVSVSARETVLSLWKSYLLSQLATDIMLGEVADGLYIERIDPASVRQMKKWYPHNAHEAAAADIGFSDDIEQVLDNLHEQPRSMHPYDTLLSRMSDDDIGNTLFDQIAAHTKRYPADMVTKSPYMAAIPASEETSGAITLGSYTYMPGEFFQTYHENFEPAAPFHYGTIGYFDKEVTVPVIYENGNVWMSIVVSEIESMRAPIEKAKGKVITYGLGLGYYPFMASEKENVESVTIIERNPDVIAVFKKVILPHFPHKEKIRIIQADAFQYIEQQKDGEYDIAFANFWDGFYDGLALYMDFVPRCEKFTKTDFDFWIEICFLDYFFRPAALEALMAAAAHPVTLAEDKKAVKKLQAAFAKFLSSDPITLRMEEDILSFLSNEYLIPKMRAFAEGYTKQ